MKNKQLISIYSKRETPRFHYAKYLVLELLLGFRVRSYADLDAFEKLKTPKINYSRLKIANSFQIDPADLLFDDEINHCDVKSTSKRGSNPILFSTKKGDIDFDPLAAAFYVVTRYEEYLPNDRDAHDRYPASQSILDKLGCLQIPIVQEWANQLKAKLITKFPTLSFDQPEFDFIPSFDIDMAWSYRYKGALRSIGGYANDIIRLNLVATKERLKVHLGQEKDPFDKFAYFQEQTAKYNLAPIFFFLMGEYSDYDKNIPADHPQFIRLIKSIAQQYKIGIHPSYYHKKNMRREINYLKVAAEKTIDNSRQHFIKLKFPDTYQLLIKNEIRADYSMGYPDKIGFRNGMAVPSLWYDLSTEKITDLMVHPFQVMDVTLKNYLHLQPAQAIEKIQNLTDTIAYYGGCMVSIWHNSSFDKDWLGWQKVFEEMLSYASKKST